MSGPHNQRLHIFTVFLRKTVFFIPNNYNYFARSAFLAILCLAEIYVFTRPNDVSDHNSLTNVQTGQRTFWFGKKKVDTMKLFQLFHVVSNTEIVRGSSRYPECLSSLS